MSDRGIALNDLQRLLSLLIMAYLLGMTDTTLFSADLNASQWSMTKGTLTEVESIFTKARQKESLAHLSLPDQTRWEAKSDADKMLYLINSERKVRGVRPLKAVSKRVSKVAQAYAERLLRHGRLTHRLDGQNSWMRLQSVPEIASCMHRIDFAENLAWFGSRKGYQRFYIERAIFTWMYDDGQHAWRHRAMLLYDDFSGNDAFKYANALIGVGVAYGNTHGKQYDIYVVLNYIDPCPSWDLE